MTKTEVIEKVLAAIEAGAAYDGWLEAALKKELVLTQYERQGRSVSAIEKALPRKLMTRLERSKIHGTEKMHHDKEGNHVYTDRFILIVLNKAIPELAFDDESVTPNQISCVLNVRREYKMFTVSRATVKAAKALKIETLRFGDVGYQVAMLNDWTLLVGDIEIDATNTLAGNYFKSAVGEGVVMPIRITDKSKTTDITEVMPEQ